MTPQKQRFRHKPEEGEFGDCHRTCLACILGIDRDLVPNFGVHYGDVAKFLASEAEFLASIGMRAIDIPFQGTVSLGTMLESLGRLVPNAHLIFAGQSRTGLNHSVIIKDGEIVWNPSLDDVGIIGPCDDGHYWITILTSTHLL